MAKLGSVLLLMFMLAAVIIAAASATSSTICNVKVSELVECLPAITGKSPPPPTKSCCSVMGKTDLHCLCNYKSDFTKFGVDPANAMALPKKCGRKLPQGCRGCVYVDGFYFNLP